MNIANEKKRKHIKKNIKEKIMSKDNQFEAYTYWYDLWMKQSKEFFISANDYLKDLFDKEKNVDPREHLDQIQPWLDLLKKQWQFMPLNDQQKTFETYFQMMNKMCGEATDLMMHQWISRSKENRPIRNIHELYTLWLDSCQEIYAKAMHSKSYQEAYGHFIDAAIKFWKHAASKST
jgi:hypothetical protein